MKRILVLLAMISQQIAFADTITLLIANTTSDPSLLNESLVVGESIASALLNTRFKSNDNYRLVDRYSRDRAITETEFALLIRPEAAKINLSAADRILQYSLVRSADKNTLSMRLIDVPTGEMLGVATETAPELGTLLAHSLRCLAITMALDYSSYLEAAKKAEKEYTTDVAIAILNVYLRFDPDNYEANLLMGDLVSRSGDSDKAIEYYCWASYQKPSVWEAYSKINRLAGGSKAYDIAECFVQRYWGGASFLDQIASLTAFSALTFSVKGDYDKAVLILETFIPLWPLKWAEGAYSFLNSLYKVGNKVDKREALLNRIREQDVDIYNKLR